MTLFALALFVTTLATPVLAQSTSCAADASKAALRLLKLHTDGDDRASVDAAVRKIGTVKPLTGKGAFNVLEVEGYVYKAEYRIRLIYAQIPGTCLLVGQEILGRANPY